MTTIVTGAAGFIGSRLVAALNRAGIGDILAVDNLLHSEKFRNLVGCEIEDYLDKREFLARLQAGNFDGVVDAVFHQGACTNTMEYDGAYMMENNYAYSKVLLDWCQDEEVPLIYASSASVYGAGRESTETRANEDPLNVYAYSKFLFDQYVRRRLDGLTAQVVGLRYFNVYGPNEAHKKRNNMNSIALRAFEQYRADGHVQLFGGCDGYADGEQRRDFIHVDDAVAVNLWLRENGGVSGIFNCGTGRAQSFNELAAAVINAVDGSQATIAELAREDRIRYIPFPPQLLGKYQSYTQADLSQLRAAGFAGGFQTVEQGVASYVRGLLG